MKKVDLLFFNNSYIREMVFLFSEAEFKIIRLSKTKMRLQLIYENILIDFLFIINKRFICKYLRIDKRIIKNKENKFFTPKELLFLIKNNL